MVRKKEKLELFCKKRTEIPSLGIAKLEGKITFELWYDQYSEFSRVRDTYMKELSQFSFSGINNPRDFGTLQNEVISEIEDNLIEATSEYQLRNYFKYIKKKLDDCFFVAEYHINDLKRISFDLEADDFKTPISGEEAQRIIFYISITQIKDCFRCYLYVKSFIEEQENLYLDKPQNIESVEIEKISDSLSHKILLLHELGVIEYLQKEFFHAQQTHRNGTDLANLLSNIIGEPTKSETIRKHLSGIHSKGKDNIVTNAGIKEVKKFLDQLNIHLKRLKEKD